MKRTLKHNYGGMNLDQQELLTALKRVLNIINARPIHIMLGPKGVEDPDHLQIHTHNILFLD